MAMIDQLMRDAVEYGRPPAGLNLGVILARGRARRRRARLAQASAVAVTGTAVVGAVALGQAIGPDRSELPGSAGSPATGTSPATAGSPGTTITPTPRSQPAAADVVTRHLDPDRDHLVAFGGDRNGDAYVVMTFDWFDGPRMGESTWQDAVNAWIQARRDGQQVEPLRNGKINLAWVDAETNLSSNERHRVTGDHKDCAVTPRRVLGPPMIWESCTTVSLPDGTTLLEARSNADGVQTIGVTHVLAAGSKVSLSVSTGGDLEDPSNDSTGIPLRELPVTMDQLRAVVLDPDMPATPPSDE